MNDTGKEMDSESDEVRRRRRVTTRGLREHTHRSQRSSTIGLVKKKEKNQESKELGTRYKSCHPVRKDNLCGKRDYDRYEKTEGRTKRPTKEIQKNRPRKTTLLKKK